MNSSQEYGRFNIYDIFSTFLPGAVLLIGIALPHPSTPSYIVGISVGGLLVWAIVAFAAGLFLQSIAGEIVSGETSFDDQMSRVVESGRDDEEVTAADVDFLETAREKFGFDAEFDDWNHLYRAVLTELEQNPPSRAIRLQALFLAMRGLVVAFIILTITTGIYTVLAVCEYITPHSPVVLLVVTTILLLLAAIFIYRRAVEFSDDVVSYMITEFRTLNS
jgi:hypothetical protein